MANEITEFGQIVTYGGAQLTLLGSPLGTLVNSILIRQGTGNLRAWKLFDPAKADFHNTYKIINLGDVVLVNAKALPMDFTILAGTVSTDTGVFVTPNSSPTSYPTILTSRFTFGTPVFIAPGTGTVQAQLDGGAFQSLSVLNGLMASVPDAQIQSGAHTFTVLVTPTSGTAITVEIPIN
jgi:hypothetical protein